MLSVSAVNLRLDHLSCIRWNVLFIICRHLTKEIDDQRVYSIVIIGYLLEKLLSFKILLL
jgi:hypothetical protein